MFEVKKHLIRLDRNRLYLPVAARLVWFRQEHPDWGIETKPILIDTEKQIAVFEASVYNAEGRLMAKGTKMETFRGFADYIEKAETGAIGRALAVCGFGTQFAPDLAEATGGRFVDAPQPPGPVTPYAASGSRTGGAAAPANGSNGNGVVKAASADAATTDGETADHACVNCGKTLTKGQEALSVRKFGSALCPDCQKERRAAEAAG